jgi:hypothetical protein
MTTSGYLNKPERLQALVTYDPQLIKIIKTTEEWDGPEVVTYNFNNTTINRKAQEYLDKFTLDQFDDDEVKVADLIIHIFGYIDPYLTRKVIYDLLRPTSRFNNQGHDDVCYISSIDGSVIYNVERRIVEAMLHWHRIAEQLKTEKKTEEKDS